MWRVFLEPEEGWRPAWEQGLVAAVVLASLIMALLVGIIMASWAQQRRLLGDVLVRAARLRKLRVVVTCFIIYSPGTLPGSQKSS